MMEISLVVEVSSPDVVAVSICWDVTAVGSYEPVIAGLKICLYCEE